MRRRRLHQLISDGRGGVAAGTALHWLAAAPYQQQGRRPAQLRHEVPLQPRLC